LKDLSFKDKRALVRVDYNVPLANEHITDDSKIAASIPTLDYILKQGGSAILMSHLGRPSGMDPKLSLAPCAKRLSELLKIPVSMAPDCIGEEVEKMAHDLKPGQVLVLENLRFHSAEEKPEKDPAFVSQLAKLGDIYVNDAFGTAHRAHASTAFIAKYFPKLAAMGFLIEKEIKELSPLLHDPKRPFYAIIGGAKVSTKIGILKQLLDLVDGLFIGGAMAFTFLKAQGVEMGHSLCEDPKTIQDIPKAKIHLPLDLVIADKPSNDAKVQIIPSHENIPKNWQGMDIGPQTALAWSKLLGDAETVFWNGPLGVFEMSKFSAGTKAVAEVLAHSKARTIIGGGDSVAAIRQMGLGSQFAHLSTGGGASLEYLEFGYLPGIDALSDK
jgi:phosphoglycerate kinase